MCEFYVYGTLDYAYKPTTHKCRGFIQGFSKPPLFPLFCLPPPRGYMQLYAWNDVHQGLESGWLWVGWQEERDKPRQREQRVIQWFAARHDETWSKSSFWRQMKKKHEKKPKVIFGRRALFLATQKSWQQIIFVAKNGSKSFSTLMFGVLKRVRC